MKAILEDIISQVQKKNIPNINYGGCGVFAVSLYKNLPKQMRPRLVVLIRGDASNYKFILKRQSNFNGLRIPHVVVRVGKLYVDNTGVSHNINDLCDGGCWGYNKVVVPFKKMENEVVKNWRKWNTDFNRTKHASILKATIKKAATKTLGNNKKMTKHTCLIQNKQ